MRVRDSLLCTRACQFTTMKKRKKAKKELQKRKKYESQSYSSPK